MYAPQNFFWYKPDDAHVEYTRCNWSYDEWVKACCQTFKTPVLQIWQTASNDSIIKTQHDDDTKYNKIFRFVHMSEKYCIDLRKFLISQNHLISITGHELWEGIQIAKRLVVDGQTRKTGDLTEMLERATTNVMQWNLKAGNSDIQARVNKFISNNARAVHHQGFLISNRQSATASLPPVNEKEIYAQTIDNDTWQQLKWLQGHGREIYVSPLALYLSLNLPFGNVRDGCNSDFGMISPKNATISLSSSTNSSIFWDPSEIDNVIDYNNQKNISLTTMSQLQDIFGVVVCYSCVVYSSLHFCMLFVIFFIVCLFVIF